MENLFSDFQYENALKGRNIRLLQILPGNTLELSVSLTTHPLSQSVGYHALSYVWGDPKKKKKAITCNGKRLLVTQSLHLALLQIRRKWPGTLVWADAICIDQQNTREKTEQVRMMRDVYFCANHVVIWLGPAEKLDQEAYEMMKLMPKTDLLQESGPPTFESWGHKELPDNPLDPKWEKFVRLLARPWFSRVWVVQELIVARSSLFLCGDLEMNTDAVMNAAIMISSQPRLVNTWGFYNASDPTKANAFGIAFLKNGLEQQGYLRLIELLFTTRGFDSTDERDKVFALAALTYGSVEMIDYNKSIEKVLIEVTELLLTHEHQRLMSPLSLLSYSVQYRKTISTPSWVIDWSQPTTRINPVTNMLPKRNQTEPGPINFSISSDKVSPFLDEYSLRCWQDSDHEQKLVAPGRIVDRISHIIWEDPYNILFTKDSILKSEEIFEPLDIWLSSVVNLLETIDKYPGKIPIEEAFWRALTRDGGTFRSPLPKSDMVLYQRWKKLTRVMGQYGRQLRFTKSCDEVEGKLLTFVNIFIVFLAIGLWQRGLQHIGFLNSFKWGFYWLILRFITSHSFRFLCYAFCQDYRHPYLADFGPQQAEMGRLANIGSFEHDISQASAGRRFCRTQRGYIGWVTHDAEEGDEVVVFNGCNVTYVVRPITSNDQDRVVKEMEGYTLKGDCYLQGLMNGEGFGFDVPQRKLIIH
jgi:hypothetical protein